MLDIERTRLEMERVRYDVWVQKMKEEGRIAFE